MTDSQKTGGVAALACAATMVVGFALYINAKDPALAVSTWLALSFVINGLGGGNEVVGGLWVLLVSVAALQTRALPKTLNYLGLVVSVAGLLTVVPALGELGSVFGLGLILWFSALGVVMLRGGKVKP